METIDFTAFLENGSRGITPASATAFRQDLPDLRLKATQIPKADVPQLAAQLDFLIEVFEDVLDEVYTELSYVAFADAVFALQYFHKGVDIIPDSVPGIGFKDDSLVTELALSRNALDFETYARSKGIDWSAVRPQA